MCPEAGRGWMLRALVGRDEAVRLHLQGNGSHRRLCSSRVRWSELCFRKSPLTSVCRKMEAAGIILAGSGR